MVIIYRWSNDALARNKTAYAEACDLLRARSSAQPARKKAARKKAAHKKAAAKKS